MGQLLDGGIMKETNYSVLFLGKQADSHCEKALAFCRLNFKITTACIGNWGDPLPKDITQWEGDYIISYLSRWVVPTFLLKRAKNAAINFHPGSPNYPGIGCNNFALYEDAREYGTTCHHIRSSVDTGDIIAVKKFPIFPADDVASLLSRTYDYQLVLFYEIVSLLINGKELPFSKEKWTRKPFTRTQLAELSKITPNMSKLEIEKRIRATNYATWKPTIDLHGIVFELKTPCKE